MWSLPWAAARIRSDFHPFIDDAEVRLLDRGGGRGYGGRHAATICRGGQGVAWQLPCFRMTMTIRETHSISAGLDYPASGRNIHT
jgi:tryptophan synthase beta subunit